MTTRIKKNITVIFGGKIWFSGAIVSLQDQAKMESEGYEVEKITEVA